MNNIALPTLNTFYKRENFQEYLLYMIVFRFSCPQRPFLRMNEEKKKCKILCTLGRKGLTEKPKLIYLLNRNLYLPISGKSKPSPKTTHQPKIRQNWKNDNNFQSISKLKVMAEVQNFKLKWFKLDWFVIYFILSTFPHSLTLYTLTSVCIFSILFSIHLLWGWQGEFVWQTQAALDGYHFLYSCYL